jgi:hypothetical protein
MKKQNKNNTLTFKKPSFLELTNKSLSKIVGGNRLIDRRYNEDDPHSYIDEEMRKTWV